MQLATHMCSLFFHCFFFFEEVGFLDNIVQHKYTLSSSLISFNSSSSFSSHLQYSYIINNDSKYYLYTSLWKKRRETFLFVCIHVFTLIFFLHCWFFVFFFIIFIVACAHIIFYTILRSTRSGRRYVYIFEIIFFSYIYSI